jgi:hypothetical protein
MKLWIKISTVRRQDVEGLWTSAEPGFGDFKVLIINMFFALSTEI